MSKVSFGDELQEKLSQPVNQGTVLVLIGALAVAGLAAYDKIQDKLESRGSKKR